MIAPSFTRSTKRDACKVLACLTVGLMLTIMAPMAMATGRCRLANDSSNASYDTQLSNDKTIPTEPEPPLAPAGKTPPVHVPAYCEKGHDEACEARQVQLTKHIEALDHLSSVLRHKESSLSSACSDCRETVERKKETRDALYAEIARAAGAGGPMMSTESGGRILRRPLTGGIKCWDQERNYLGTPPTCCLKRDELECTLGRDSYYYEELKKRVKKAKRDLRSLHGDIQNLDDECQQLKAKMPKLILAAKRWANLSKMPDNNDSSPDSYVLGYDTTPDPDHPEERF